MQSAFVGLWTVYNHALLLALPIICREAERNSTNKTISLTDRCSQCIPPQEYHLMLTCTQWKVCTRQYTNWLPRTRLEFHNITANYCSYLEMQLDGRCATDIVKSDEWFWAILKKTSCHNRSTFRIPLQTKLVRKLSVRKNRQQLTNLKS